MTEPDITRDAATLPRLMVELFRHITRRRRVQFALLFGLTLVSSVAEVVSLGVVVPFIGILTQPEQVFAQPRLAGFVRAMGIASASELVLPLALAFAVASLIAGALRLSLLWTSVRLSAVTGVDFSIDVYRRTLYQPYRVHVARNSSEIVSGVTQKVGNAATVLMSVVTVTTSMVLFVAILATLLAINPGVAIAAMATLGVGYVLIAWLTRHRLTQNSRVIAETQTTVVTNLQSGLGAIRDVLIDGTQAVYTEVYAREIRLQNRAGAENTFLNQAPRYLMETFAMVLVAAFVYAISGKPGSLGAALPVLGALGLGAQRLLPLLQLMYANWSAAVGGKAALIDVLALLDQPLPDDASLPAPEPLALRNEIRFENVRFRYGPAAPWVLNGIDLTIPKGARVGFVGTTGSGKSTALDLLMALLDPTDGAITVDGRPITGELRRSWQGTIAHVPQTIFLADTTIAENIAFGIPRESIDPNRVRDAAKQAQIADFVESRPEAYDAIVGERGVRLSGGQRQRIGIARALYKHATVLIFDEATSALDTPTETAVMSAIDHLDRSLTVFLVAHRVTSLEHCDMIVELDGGQIRNLGSYDSFINRNGLNTLAPADA